MMFLVLFVIQIVLASAEFQDDCTVYPGYIRLPGSLSCYYFSKDKKTFWEAVLYCNRTYHSENSVLVRIEDQAENGLIHGQLKLLDKKGSYWIGVEVTSHDPLKLKYADCGEPVFTNFAPGEPNNHNGNEECSTMIRWRETWNDDRCEKKKKYICEIPTTFDLYCCNKTCEVDETGYNSNFRNLIPRDVCVIKEDKERSCVKIIDYNQLANGVAISDPDECCGTFRLYY
ncbi:hypothetical protein ScPMuIL_003317 [Solemya velum]